MLFYFVLCVFIYLKFQVDLSENIFVQNYTALILHSNFSGANNIQIYLKHLVTLCMLHLGTC